MQLSCRYFLCVKSNSLLWMAFKIQHMFYRKLWHKQFIKQKILNTSVLFWSVKLKNVPVNL